MNFLVSLHYLKFLMHLKMVQRISNDFNHYLLLFKLLVHIMDIIIIIQLLMVIMLYFQHQVHLINHNRLHNYYLQNNCLLYSNILYIHLTLSHFILVYLFHHKMDYKLSYISNHTFFKHNQNYSILKITQIYINLHLHNYFHLYHMVNQ